MLTDIMLHMQVSSHIIVSTHKCHISNLCVKLPWFLRVWWDWYHLIPGLFTSLLLVKQLGSLCSSERNRHLKGVLPDLFARAQGQEEPGSGYVDSSPPIIRGVQSFVLELPSQHPVLLLPMPAVSPCIPDWWQLPQETRGQETQPAAPCNPSRQEQGCNQRSFLKVGQAARYIYGKGRHSGICHGRPKDWNTMVPNVLHKPSTETTQHTSMLCSNFFLFLQTPIFLS